MTRRNRVDPWGDLHAVPARGMFTGNRGCLVDDDGAIVRHHRSTTLWITCRTSFRGWRHPLDAPHVWTPLFFLDDAVALAAGHRPCATCRRDDYRAYRDAVAAADGGPPPLAAELDRRLTAERLRRGRGFDRRADRRLWTADVDDLPDAHGDRRRRRRAAIVVGDTVRSFTFDGWAPARPRPRHATGRRAHARRRRSPRCAAGFVPTLHPSARADARALEPESTALVQVRCETSHQIRTVPDRVEELDPWPRTAAVRDDRARVCEERRSRQLSRWRRR